MARPRRFLVRMILFLIAVLVVLAILFPQLEAAFLANVPLNGLILGVLLLGIVYNFRQVTMLDPEVAWIESFRYNQQTLSQPKAPKLLAPMATMLGERKDRLSLSPLSMRSLLDGIQSRLDESRDISRYVIGLLIFLGLLGTFWGLLDTVASIRGVISGLSIGSGDVNTVFSDLKSGLNAPLSGMGTAFSSSLFGLGGSLVLGFLDLQGGQAQNHFFTQVEDWLSSLTRLSSGVLPGDGDHGVPAYVQALLEQTAESLENLQVTLARSEEGRISSSTNMVVLVEKLGTLTDHMRTEQALMMQLVESQTELKNILAKLADRVGHSAAGMDEATRTHIRNLDVYVARLLEELSTGRDDIIHQVRSEIKLLARTIAAIAEEAER